MIFKAAKNIILISLMIVLTSSWVLAIDRTTGKSIKSQASVFFAERGLNLNLLVSDKRSFFPCSGPLSFNPKYENNWSTVLVSCDNEKWQTFIRSTLYKMDSTSPKSTINREKLKVAVLIRNIAKGEVITSEYLGFEERAEQRIHGAYSHISEILGRKAKNNIAAGTILKARHLTTSYSVDKNDSVLVIAENKAITITTSAIALENGQLGDMIAVRNLKSNKIFKVIITGKKKVAPITNM